MAVDDLLFLWASGVYKEPTSSIYICANWSALPSTLVGEAASPCSGHRLIQRLISAQNVGTKGPLSTQSFMGHLYHQRCLHRGSGTSQKVGWKERKREPDAEACWEMVSSGPGMAEVLTVAMVTCS